MQVFFYKKVCSCPIKNQTCGGVSRAILAASLRTPAKSSTVVHSFAVALTYHQSCLTIHPPVAFKAIARSLQNLTKSLFENQKFPCVNSDKKTLFLKNYGISVKKVWSSLNKRAAATSNCRSPEGQRGGYSGRNSNLEMVPVKPRSRKP